jgi:excinuclease ABC subunit A
MRETPCPTCNGARLKPEVLAVTIADRNIAQICELSIAECAKFLKGIHYLLEKNRLQNEF